MEQEDKKPSLFRSLFPDENLKKEETPKKAYKGTSKAEELDVRFAENFSDSGGKFIYCDDASIFFKLLSSLQYENDWNQFFVCDSDINIFMNDYHFKNGEGFQKMEDCDVAISYCYAILADEGVVILEPHQATNRRLTTFPNHHVIIAKGKNLYENLDEALNDFSIMYNDKLPSLIDLNEDRPVYNANKSRLLNAEGTNNVYVFFIDDDME